MKLICFALHQEPSSEIFEYRAYLRGLYFNCRFANLVFPDWRVHLDVDRATYERFQNLFDWLKSNNNLHLVVWDRTPVLCEGMLRRLSAAFIPDVSHILCRDADSLLTYKEAAAIQEWLESGYGFHAMTDNPAHSGLMGGMVGISTSKLKALTGFHAWEDMIYDAAGFDLTQLEAIKRITPLQAAIDVSNLAHRGSDQNYLNSKILPLIASDLLVHAFEGAGVPGAAKTVKTASVKPPQVDPRLWESTLCIAFTGAAGVNDLEVLRFLKRMDPENNKFKEIEKEYPQLFYWTA